MFLKISIDGVAVIVYNGPCGIVIAKLSSSWLVKWLVELRLALSSIITTPTHPPTPGKVEIQLEIDHIYGQWVAGG